MATAVPCLLWGRCVLFPSRGDGSLRGADRIARDSDDTSAHQCGSARPHNPSSINFGKMARHFPWASVSLRDEGGNVAHSGIARITSKRTVMNDMIQDRPSVKPEYEARHANVIRKLRGQAMKLLRVEGSLSMGDLKKLTTHHAEQRYAMSTPDVP